MAENQSNNDKNNQEIVELKERVEFLEEALLFANLLPVSAALVVGADIVNASWTELHAPGDHPKWISSFEYKCDCGSTHNGDVTISRNAIDGALYDLPVAPCGARNRRRIWKHLKNKWKAKIVAEAKANAAKESA